MTNDEAKKMFEQLSDKDVSFTLMTLAKENEGYIDRYYCHCADSVQMEDLIGTTLAYLVTQLLETRISTDDIKHDFNCIIDAVGEEYNKRNMLC